MKKTKIILAAVVAAMASTRGSAQLMGWGGAGGPGTFTYDNVGIGAGAVPTDAKLHIFGFPEFIPCADGKLGNGVVNARIPELWLDRQVQKSKSPGECLAHDPNLFQTSRTNLDPSGTVLSVDMLDVINGGGWLGILTANPQEALHVIGNAKITGGTIDMGDVPGDVTRQIIANSNSSGLQFLSGHGGEDGAWIGLHTLGEPGFNGAMNLHTVGTGAFTFYNYTGPTPNAVMSIQSNGEVRISNIPTASDGFYLTTDGTTGLITKRPLSSTGDDLGSHKAIKDLNMNSFNIINAANISATSANLGGISGTSLNLGSGGTITAGNTNVNDITGRSLTIGAVGGGIICGSNISASGSLNGNSLHIAGGFGGVCAQFDNDVNIDKKLTAKDGAFTSSLTLGGVGVQTVSDQRFKKNVENIDGILNKLFQVTPRKYNFIKESSDYFQFDDKLHYGFIAQNVEEIFPELVRKVDKDGHLGVLYTEFIPILCQALKEEDAIIKANNEHIASLEERIAALEANNSSMSAGKSAADVRTNTTIKSTLFQNTPNPFNKETTIGFNIVGNYQRAFIGIYDLNGKEMRKIELQPESKQITISGGTLTSGMYIYSLVVDDQLIDTKKMVIN